MAKRNISKSRFPEVVAAVKIHTANDQYVCLACRDLAEKVFLVKEAPSLPYAKCTDPKDCRCWVTPIVDDDEVQKNLNKIFHS